jgi:hypothetical protein
VVRDRGGGEGDLCKEKTGGKISEDERKASSVTDEEKGKSPHSASKR